MTNHHVIATFPGAGIEVLKILNTSIISRHPAIGFVVTEGELDIGHGFKPSSHNWTRPVTAEGVVVNDYALVYPSGKIDRVRDDFGEAESFSSLMEFECALLDEKEAALAAWDEVRVKARVARIDELKEAETA